MTTNEINVIRRQIYKDCSDAYGNIDSYAAEALVAILQHAYNNDETSDWLARFDKVDVQSLLEWLETQYGFAGYQVWCYIRNLKHHGVPVLE